MILDEYVFVERSTIRDFLRKFGHGPGSKDYELVIAIVLSKFFEDLWKSPTLIGFELKKNKTNLVPKKSTFSAAEIETVFRSYLESATPVDIAIVKGTLTDHESKGPAFQLKRFGKNPNEKSTQDLIRFINNIPNKYAKTPVSLLLVLEFGGEIDTDEIRRSIITTSYPLDSIKFILKFEKTVTIGEFWPNPGMTEFPIEKLLTD